MINFFLKRKAARGGFTLIETIIYIAILSGAMLFLMFTFYQILESNRTIRTRLTVEAESRFLMGKIEWALLGLQTVSQPSVGSTSSLLSVNKYNSSGNPLIFDLASSTVRLKRGAGEALALTNSEVAVSPLIFQHLAASGTLPAAIKITFSLRSLRADAAGVSTTLENTIYLRQ